ncbi:MAG TPA: PAS domain-containing protein, partial [Gemmatimonadales bacterium]|nr:PAS domain-containing protein [Gemmatimonadales bacterium]
MIDGLEGGPEGIAEILLTAELARRPASPTDHEAELEAYRRLARRMAGNPDVVLGDVVAEALKLCSAGTAGVSVLDEDDRGIPIFRWSAVAGVGKSFTGYTVPAHATPCGVAVTDRAPQLFRHPNLVFPALATLDVPLHEALVVPLPEGSRRPGTLWIIAHDPDCHFNATHAATLRGLADFAAAAIGQTSRVRRLVGDPDELAELADAMPQLVWMAREDGTVDYYNRVYAEYAGFAAKLDGTFDWADSLHPDDVRTTADAWARAVRTGERYEHEHRVRTARGEYRWHVSRAEPVRDEAGRIVRWYGT